MRIALSQINPTLGDFSHNAALILKEAQKAKETHCDLVVFPEMTIFGYHPGDLLERSSIVDLQIEELNSLIAKLPKGISCLFGGIEKNPNRGKAYYNSVFWVENNSIIKTFQKQLLPVYDVFDDNRHFTPGKISNNIIQWNNKKILVLICEDMWGWDPIHPENPIEALQSTEVDIIVNLSASPFTLEKKKRRLSFARKTAEHLQAPLVYVNMVGGQDELIFDGGSFALSQKGELLTQSAHFIEDFNYLDLPSQSGQIRNNLSESIADIHQALVLGLRDFVRKVGLSKVHLGLSGGIDSSVVACLAADALGPAHVTGLAMPSQFNSMDSLTLASQLAKNLQINFFELPIHSIYESVLKNYQNVFGEKPFTLFNENLQARLRGLNLMAYSNENNSMLLGTSNKAELAAGFMTLYGDMCGGINPIGDLLKHQVFELAAYYNQQQELIPKGILSRAPSAELRPNQKDSDSLPDYKLLDPAVHQLICEKKPANNETEKWLIERVMTSEFKRWQSPPILKVTSHAFGQGRRIPIAHKARC